MWAVRNVCDLYPFGTWPPTLAPYCGDVLGPINWSPREWPSDPVYGILDERYPAAAEAPASPEGDAESAVPVSGLGFAQTLDPNVLWSIQVFLNEELKKLGKPQVRADGVADAATCQGLLAVLSAVQKGAKVDPTFGDLMRENGAAMDAICAQLLKAPAAQPPPPAETVISSFPITNIRPGGGGTPSTDFPLEKCFINFGDRSEIITAIQKQVNAKLDSEGYESIPVSGQWDPATCGAIFFLKGRFQAAPVPPCPYYEVPLECPSTIEPKKKGGSMKIAWIAGGIVAAGLVGLVAYTATKTR